jgi:hypothetical protein
VWVALTYTASEHIVSGVFQKGEHSAIWVSENEPRVQKSHYDESLDDTCEPTGVSWSFTSSALTPLPRGQVSQDTISCTARRLRSLAARRILKLFLKFVELSCGEISVGGSIASFDRLCVFSQSHRASWECRLDPLCCRCIPSLCSLSHRRRLVRGLEVSVSHGYPGCKPSDNKEAVQHYVNGASVGTLCLLLTADIFLVLVEEAEGSVLHDRWSVTEMVFNVIDDRGRR